MTPDRPVPNFDDDAAAAAGGGRKLCIICSKGSLDMAYPGLILANAALGEGVETHLFFTFWGFEIIRKKTMADLQFTPVGNPASHMPALAAVLPGMQTMATRMMRRQIADLEVPTIPEMLDLIVDAGGHLWACRMSADMLKLKREDLHERVEGVIGATEFIEISAGAQTLFV